jgi:hypothetical protein
VDVDVHGGRELGVTEPPLHLPGVLTGTEQQHRAASLSEGMEGDPFELEDDEPEEGFDHELWQQDLAALQDRLGRALTEAEHEDITGRIFSPRGDADGLTVAQAFEQAGDRFPKLSTHRSHRARV